jgi:3-hydroxyisobutyrate dehydrogenase-like beta-hydroxyacid dehydrogenase
MVTNILSKYPLTTPLILFNRTASRTEAFAATLPSDKISVANTLEEVAKADVILSCVSDDAAIKETVEGILTSIPEGEKKLFIDCSTIHPDTSNEIGAQLEKAGHSFVAMPVFGAPAAADAGQLVCVLAGPHANVQRALPFTKAIGRLNIDLSDQPYGQALLLKVIGNSFIINIVEQLAEGHVLAEKSGLGTENLDKFIQAMLPPVYGAYSKRMLTGDYYDREGGPLFGVDLARKDARHAIDLAKSAGTRLLNIETADAHLAKVKEAKGEDGDMPGIYGVVRQEAGLPFENGKKGQ